MKELVECLQWFVDNDDTNPGEDNRYWLDGLARAQAVLQKVDTPQSIELRSLNLWGAVSGTCGGKTLRGEDARLIRTPDGYEVKYFDTKANCCMTITIPREALDET